MKSNTVATVFSWIALLFGIACSFGLVLAASTVLSIKAGSSGGYGMVFLLVTSYLALLGVLALVTGAVGLRVGRDTATVWRRRRSWFAIIVGALAAVVGAVYGVSLLG